MGWWPLGRAEDSGGEGAPAERRSGSLGGLVGYAPAPLRALLLLVVITTIIIIEDFIYLF